MARVSIYVSEELKARMDAAGDAINWSGIVRPAIHAEVAKYENQKGQTMETVIARLRASREETKKYDRETGLKAGREWAKNYATYDQLKRLRTGWDNLRNLDCDFHRENFYAILEVDCNVAKECFGDANAEPTSEYVSGFFEGAVALFDEVKDQL